MTVWYSSDFHFHHSMVADTRGHVDVDAHDAEILTYWTNTVQAGDDVWILGDLALSKNGAMKAFGYLEEMPGRKHLIIGNHDLVWPGSSRAHKFSGMYGKVFDSVAFAATRKIGGTPSSPVAHAIHRRPHRDGQACRVEAPRPSQRSHAPWTHPFHREDFQVHSRGSMQVHVGWDAWRSFVKEDTIAELIRSEPT